MNLGELRAIVDTWTDKDFVFLCSSFRNPHSYRGYYNELSFSPSNESVTVRSIREYVDRAESDIFTGWKGGEYTYGHLTPVHLSCEGSNYDDDGSVFDIRVKEMNREYQEAHSYNYSFNSKVCYNTPMETKTETKMATKRKTAAEKRIEAEALRLEKQQYEDEKFVDEYKTRLLNLVHAYVSELSYSLEAKDEASYKTFEFRTSRYSDVRLPVQLENDTRTVDQLREDMEEAEHFLEVTREAQRKERELAEKRMNALSKLTKEERELLGL